MISTHILDTSRGHAASGIRVTLEKQSSTGWNLVGAEKTNGDGRIQFQAPPEEGIYRLTFGVDAYYQSQRLDSFFVDTPVIFRIKDTKRKYHVPLLLNPFGFSIYRGT